MNYGWGGQNDGWFDLVNTSGDYITDVDLGFVPYNSVQVDPLPAYSTSSVTLTWHSPEHWKNAITGYSVSATQVGSVVSTFEDDFETAKGTLSGMATLFRWRFRLNALSPMVSMPSGIA